MLEIYIGRRFLKGSCYSQQIIFAIAIEALIPLHQEYQKHKIFNVVKSNNTLNQIKQIQNTRLSFLNGSFDFIQT